jgi:hypothetical protein
MTFADQLGMALAFSLSHLGTILVSVVGLLFAVLKREQLGRVARWAIGGFGLFLLYSFVGVAARTGLEVYRIENNAGPTDDTYELPIVTGRARGPPPAKQFHALVQ